MQPHMLAEAHQCFLICEPVIHELFLVSNARQTWFQFGLTKSNHLHPFLFRRSHYCTNAELELEIVLTEPDIEESFHTSYHSVSWLALLWKIAQMHCLMSHLAQSIMRGYCCLSRYEGYEKSNTSVNVWSLQFKLYWSLKVVDCAVAPMSTGWGQIDSSFLPDRIKPIWLCPHIENQWNSLFLPALLKWQAYSSWKYSSTFRIRR